MDNLTVLAIFAAIFGYSWAIPVSFRSGPTMATTATIATTNVVRVPVDSPQLRMRFRRGQFGQLLGQIAQGLAKNIDRKPETWNQHGKLVANEPGRNIPSAQWNYQEPGNYYGHHNPPVGGGGYYGNQPPMGGQGGYMGGGYNNPPMGGTQGGYRPIGGHQGGYNNGGMNYNPPVGGGRPGYNMGGHQGGFNQPNRPGYQGGYNNPTMGGPPNYNNPPMGGIPPYNNPTMGGAPNYNNPPGMGAGNSFNQGMNPNMGMNNYGGPGGAYPSPGMPGMGLHMRSGDQEDKSTTTPRPYFDSGNSEVDHLPGEEYSAPVAIGQSASATGGSQNSLAPGGAGSSNSLQSPTNSLQPPTNSLQSPSPDVAEYEVDLA